MRRVGVVECFNFIFWCSHQVFNGFAKCSPSSQGVPQYVPNITSLYPICFAQILSSCRLLNIETYMVLYLERILLNWEVSKVSELFVMGQSKRLSVRTFGYPSDQRVRAVKLTNFLMLWANQRGSMWGHSATKWLKGKAVKQMIGS